MREAAISWQLSAGSCQLSAVSDRGLATADAANGCTVGALVADVAAIIGDRREARDLVSLVLDETPGWVAGHDDFVVSEELRAAARACARRRARGAPLAYATGRAPFRHIVLDLDHRVLIPRPETEIVVDEVLRACQTAGGIAIDVGTGSGAIALSLALEGRFDRVIGTDVSLDALAVARSNLTRLSPRLASPVELRHGTLLEPVRDVKARAVVSNPPYVAAAEMLQLPRSVRDWEPPVALVAGTDGLGITFAIIAQAASVLEPGGWLVVECDERRARTVAARIESHGSFAEVAVRRDLTGRDRVVSTRLRYDTST